MKIVITGGAGFIGSNLARELLGRPEVDHVVAFDNLSTGNRANLDGVDADLMVETVVLDSSRPYHGLFNDSTRADAETNLELARQKGATTR